MKRKNKNTLSSKIWQRVVALAAERGLDVDALCAGVGISPARAHAFSDGTDVMRIDDLSGISEMLGIPIVELLSGIE